MKKRILWIEDDYYAIKGLVRPLEKAGFQIDIATAAVEGFRKATNWETYDLILADLIMPLSDSGESLPEIVGSWAIERYAGVGLLKWMMLDLKVGCPVLIVSVVQDPISTFDLGDLGLAGYLLKRGLLPSEVKKEVYRVLEIAE